MEEALAELGTSYDLGGRGRLLMHTIARRARNTKQHGLLLTSFWESRSGVLSTQVLQEFYVNMTRKLPRPLRVGQARRIVARYATWPSTSSNLATLSRLPGWSVAGVSRSGTRSSSWLPDA